MPSVLQLEGTTWILESFANETGSHHALLDPTVSAKFSDGDVAGSSGCNFYSASYHLNKTGIKIESIRSTLMFCEDPAGVMMQEASYLMVLQNVSSYTISSNTLTLSGSLGNERLVFQAALNVTTASAAT